MTLTLALAAAAEAAASQTHPKATLYVVATPIGNLADISLRALHVLQLCDAVACEDTRHTQRLLGHYGLNKPLLAVHQHNEASAAQAVLKRLQQGERVACVSDAGTPALSDPGARLVQAVQAAGFAVTPLPGASSVTAALSVAGVVATEAMTQGFVFAGFLSSKAQERQQQLQALRRETRAVVILEAPHRIAALAQGLGQAFLADPNAAHADPGQQRRLTVCRELTKQFEQVLTMPCSDFSAWLTQDPVRSKGEFTLVVHPPVPDPDRSKTTPADWDAALALLLQHLPLKTAVDVCTQLSGAQRKVLYERALQMKAAGSAQSE